MTTVDCYISHSIAGRIRIKIPSKQGDSDYFYRLKDQLINIEGIESARGNPITASVLIHHSATAWDELSQAIEKKKLLAFGEIPNLAELALTKVKDNFRLINNELNQVSGRDMDLRSLAFILLILMAVVQLMRGHIMAPAATLFWYASQLLGEYEP